MEPTVNPDGSMRAGSGLGGVGGSYGPGSISIGSGTGTFTVSGPKPSDAVVVGLCILGAAFGLVVGPVAAVVGAFIGAFLTPIAIAEIARPRVPGYDPPEINRLRDSLKEREFKEYLGPDIYDRYRQDQLKPKANYNPSFRLQGATMAPSDFQVLTRYMHQGGTLNSKHKIMVSRMTGAQRRAGGLFLVGDRAVSLRLLSLNAVRNIRAKRALSTYQKLGLGLHMYGIPELW